MEFRTIEWKNDAVVLLDQTRLPDTEIYIRCETVDELIEAIRRLSVRGAPAIGVAGAYGAALAATRRLEAAPSATPAEFSRSVAGDLARLREARPTAVNLAWAVDRQTERLDSVAARPPAEQREALLALAREIHEEDAASCEAIGRFGSELIPDRATVLTHCNAGALATSGLGTALAVVYAAHRAGKQVEVLSDETRPLLQGARLTSWECRKMGVPVTVLCDNAAGWILSQGKVDRIVVGADRIAANGDAANKIGTYPLAVLAREHGVPFYVAAPLSTVDFAIGSGKEIPIEERSADEVTTPRGLQITPMGMKALNPAFDVTPAALIAAIITDRGVAEAPYRESLQRLREAAPPA
ncbi:MAG: S-methyl-5-thioribose-1-phosphate isomerase [bacterium]